MLYKLFENDIMDNNIIKKHTEDLSLFKNLKQNILSEIDFLWENNLTKFVLLKSDGEIEYEILLNDQIKILSSNLGFIYFKKSIFYKRKSDGELTFYDFEFRFDDEDVLMCESEIFKVIDLIYDTEEEFCINFDELNLLLNSVKFDDTSFFEVVSSFIEKDKLSRLMFYDVAFVLDSEENEED